MNHSVSHNRRWVLASRPQGAPVAENFRLETQPVPEPGAGQLLLRTVWLSLDPYMRGRMSDAPSYSPPVELGAGDVFHGALAHALARHQGLPGAVATACDVAAASATTLGTRAWLERVAPQA